MYHSAQHIADVQLISLEWMNGHRCYSLILRCTFCSLLINQSISSFRHSPQLGLNNQREKENKQSRKQGICIFGEEGVNPLKR